MSAIPGDLLPRGGVWTTDDLDAMPETLIRYEILDGTLIVSPSPTDLHQTIGWRLPSILDGSCPEGYDVTQAVEVRINKTRSFVPDVLVVTDSPGRPPSSIFDPGDVVLAIEIVSPSSRSMDAVLKPTMYAEAGIGLYWRVETDPMIVVTYGLDTSSGSYVETGRFTDTVVTDEPWPITFSLNDLKPRRLR
jgi:Uma2 family endonuclease